MPPVQKLAKNIENWLRSFTHADLRLLYSVVYGIQLMEVLFSGILYKGVGVIFGGLRYTIYGGLIFGDQ